MKILKKVSLLCLTSILIPQTIYTVILTGPVRRHHNKEEQEQAYEQGLNKDSYMNQIYDDDANVVVQSVSQPSTKTPATANQFSNVSKLTPEQKSHLKELIMNKIKNASHSNVTIQLIESTHPQTTEVHTPGTQNTSEQNSEHEATSDHDQQETQSHSVSATASDNHPQAVESHQVDSLKSTEHQTDKETRVEGAHADATHPVKATTAAQAHINETHEIPTSPLAAPKIAAAHTAAITNEEMHTKATDIESKKESVKIIKIYPAYEILSSAVHSIQTSAQDMMQYVYNFFSTMSKKIERHKADKDAQVQLQSYKDRRNKEGSSESNSCTTNYDCPTGYDCENGVCGF